MGVDREAWKRLWARHRGKIVGAGAGFLFGVLLMAVGLFWAIVIAAFTVAGYVVGSRWDEGQEGLAELLDRIMQGRR